MHTYTHIHRQGQSDIFRVSGVQIKVGGRRCCLMVIKKKSNMGKKQPKIKVNFRKESLALPKKELTPVLECPKPPSLCVPLHR